MALYPYRYLIRRGRFHKDSIKTDSIAECFRQVGDNAVFRTIGVKAERIRIYDTDPGWPDLIYDSQETN